MVLVKTKNLKQKMVRPGTWYISKNHKIFFRGDFQSYSQKAADIIVNALREVLQRKEIAVFVPSSGKSPKGIYKILRQKYREEIDWGRVVVVQMDEYWKISCNDLKSLSINIERNIIRPLGIKKYIHFFDSNGRLTQTLHEYDRFIEEMGGIDVVLHGIGRNGHIGFNEPGSDWLSPTRKIILDDSTLEANISKSDFGILSNHRLGVTIGLRLLTRAKHAILLLSGSSKNAIVEKFFFEKPSEAIPASSLCLNSKVDCVVDGESIF